MSISVTGYTEAKIEDKWYCIDFFQYDMNGHVHHVPCIEGQSIVHTALQWDCDMDRIGVPTDLSPQVKAECTGRDGKLFGEDDPHWNPWHMIRGSWFGSVDLDQPEYCGYFPRQAVADYLSNPHDVTLDESDMIPVEEYRELPEEEKKAYQYYEYTSPYGNRAILRDFKRAVQARIDAWNSEIAFCKDHMQISLSDVRVLLIIGRKQRNDVKVIGWTGWDDPRYPDDYGDDPLLEERKKVVVEELRKHNYHISGYYHQGGKRGVPVFDDGNWLRISFRSWGQIMADAYPEEIGQTKSAYIVWAWCSPCEPKDMLIPRKEDYPEFEFWEGPFPEDDSNFI